MIESYPLYWPEGWKRTQCRWRSAFKQTLGKARDFTLNQVYLLGGGSVILSSNVPTRNDGLLYARWSEPSDPGAAIYFTYKKRSMCFACDQYDLVRDNIYAIGMTINALRGIERWGASDMMERAFRGFTALPEAGWRTVLELGLNATPDDVEAAFKRLAHVYHPDKPENNGGDPTKFDAIVKAREQARKELGA